MLQIIKDAIDSLPQESFGEFYQRYVASFQDSLIDFNVSKSADSVSNIDDTKQIIEGLNILTKELQRI